MNCVNLLYFAYLRLRKSLPANTRLFYGVERETKMEKSKSAYNFEVGHIALTTIGN